jgi:hypothetical protein
VSLPGYELVITITGQLIRAEGILNGDIKQADCTSHISGGGAEKADVENIVRSLRARPNNNDCTVSSSSSQVDFTIMAMQDRNVQVSVHIVKGGIPYMGTHLSCGDIADAVDEIIRDCGRGYRSDSVGGMLTLLKHQFLC